MSVSSPGPNPVRGSAGLQPAGPRLVAAALLAAGLAVSGPTGAQDTGHPNFLSPHAAPVAAHGGLVFVVNTPADTLDVIDAATLQIIRRVNVGIDPVSLAVRPDGREIWVSNHVSDSVSVIDSEPASPTYLQIVATVQDFDPATRATRFDEPVGIAFADNQKAYVALSSDNRVAIVDVATRQVTGGLAITAQDPRAIAVRGDRLYVVPFESNNRTQISGCTGPLDGDLCTFDATRHVIDNNNVLSLHAVVDIIRRPDVPDRDLYVFDTATDQLVEIVDSLGTLLYGLAIDSRGRVFVAQTDARNDANGRTGTLGEGLAEMENRAFLNQVGIVDCGDGCGTPGVIELEPLPPAQPAPGMALATPFAIAVSDDDTTLAVTAAGSNMVFTLDASSGTVLGRAEVGKVPRGIALESDQAGEPARAWVLNAVSNTVSLVDLVDPSNPQVTATIALEDPTHPAVRRGRIAFNNAAASTSGTFSCESCHPDGGTDQLVWVLDTPPCDLPGCTQIPPRLTMPIRGLRDVAPYHWDGIPGDPYGGNNTANIRGSDPPNCSRSAPESCTRHLVDGSLATTMCRVGACPTNDEGKAGALSAAERDDLATFLLSVPYPPAQRRSYDNVLSERARAGFSLFHIQGDLQGDPEPNICGNCHRMPFWVSTNTPGTGMDAPTWRGAYDRWMILPQARVNLIDFDFYRASTERGTPEREMWQLSWVSRPRFDPVWNMVLEGSTGFAGAFGRQVTLSPDTADANLTADLLDALERAAAEGGVVLQVDGVFSDAGIATPVALRYEPGYPAGRYVDRDDGAGEYTRAGLVAAAAEGRFVGTFTGRLGTRVDVDHPQPAIWTLGPIAQQRGRQEFPRLVGTLTTLRVSGRHIQPGAHVYVDGRRVAASVRCFSGELPDCQGETVEVQLAALPENTGMHFLQIQNFDGLFSNDFIFRTTTAGAGAPVFDVSGPWFNSIQDGHGWFVEQVAAAEPGEPDQLVVYWYVYLDGEPVWLLGLGPLVDGIARLGTFITSGADFPPDFDPASVELVPWGTMNLQFADDQFGSVSWTSRVDGFGSGSVNIQRLAWLSNTPAACRSGSYYNPEQDGHGFVAQVVEVDGAAQVLLTWYVYRDGKQVWLLGIAPLGDGQAVVPMSAYSGADFPPDFAPADVQGTPWGTVTLRFTGPDSARVDWTSELTGYGAGGMDLARLTHLAGRTCD